MEEGKQVPAAGKGVLRGLTPQDSPGLKAERQLIMACLVSDLHINPVKLAGQGIIIPTLQMKG